MSSPAVIESINKYHIPGTYLVARVWREQAGLQETYLNEDIDQFIAFLRNHHTPNYGNDFGRWAMRLLEFDRVSAVEVTDSRNGEGIVLYKEWP